MLAGKYGIEAEYALVREDGSFCDYTNTSYEELSPLLNKLPDHHDPELFVWDKGIKIKNWYVEGDDRLNNEGELIGFAVKGIEIRTPALKSVAEAFESLDSLRSELRSVLKPAGFSLTSIGFNPSRKEYAPEYSNWELEYRSKRPAYKLSEISTLSYGPDLNFSFPEWNTEEVLNAARRLTYYSPYIVPFSFSSPFHNNNVWHGLSYRTFNRTGPRPAALAHLLEQQRSPLSRVPKVPAQEGRIEFKAFDMVQDEELLKELFYFVVAIALAPEKLLPGKSDVPDRALHQEAALHGFESKAIEAGASLLMPIAQDVLKQYGYPNLLPRLDNMLVSKRTPAHDMLETYAVTGKFFSTEEFSPEELGSVSSSNA